MVQTTKKAKAIKLRLSGKSYGEIIKILDIPSKGTLSVWFKDLKLSFRAKKRLEHNLILAQERGLLRFNKERTKAIELENKQIRKNYSKEINKLSRRDLFLIGIALYWGEGSQSEKNKSACVLKFVNSNPYMIALFLRFVREILKIDDGKIRSNIRLHPNIEKEKVIRFWQKITKLPHDRFRLTYQISSASKLRRPFNSLPHGTIDIRVNSRRLFYRMKGYIDGLAFQSGV